MASVAFHTLGCKLNFAESSDLLRRFLKDGFTEGDFHKKNDIYVINTCTVTSVAERKCRTAIRLAHKLNPDAVIAVIGCFSQVANNEIAAIEGVNIILGNDDKHLLVSKVKDFIKEKNQHNIIPQTFNFVKDISSLETFYSGISFTDRTRGFLKIQDGCDNFCTYCEIPFARGRSRSCTINEAVNDTKELICNGKKEIVLTGVNTGDFGKNNNETFLDLIKALDTIDGQIRYRISSIEPDLISKEIIDFCSQSDKFMPHFHIPLQSGSDVVLKNMNRRYLREEFLYKVNYIHSIMPNAFIACDVMTGFNSETESEFIDSYNFLSGLPIAFIHVFTYSDRKDTKAYRIPGRVPIDVRRERSRILQELSEKKKKDFYLSNVGYKSKIIWEEKNSRGVMHGYSDNYLKCSRAYNPELINTITEEVLENLSPCGDEFLID